MRPKTWNKSTAAARDLCRPSAMSWCVSPPPPVITTVKARNKRPRWRPKIPTHRSHISISPPTFTKDRSCVVGVGLSIGHIVGRYEVPKWRARGACCRVGTVAEDRWCKTGSSWLLPARVVRENAEMGIIKRN